MASDGDWGDAQASDLSKQRHAAWEALPGLPARGTNLQFDKLLDAKALEPEDLERIGARWGQYDGDAALVYFYVDGLKWRVVSSGQKMNEKGADYQRLKVIRARTAEPSSVIVVVEGETDAAQMSAIAPHVNVGMLPTGAQGLTAVMIQQMKRFDTVVLALDNDQAGQMGTEKIQAAIPEARILPLPEDVNDWCDARKAGLIDVGWDPLEHLKPRGRLTYSLRDVLAADLGDFEANNWFEHPIAPTCGLIVIHAKKKSLKSFIMFEMLRAIATGTAFAQSSNFVRPEGPGRVLLFQLEIPPWYFQQRMKSMLALTPPDQHELFLDNFHVREIGSGIMPRVKVGDGFIDHVLKSADECGAEVLAFDPIQRMTGSASLDKANEVDALLDSFAQLQQHGFTVVFSHHNNKASGRNTRDADSMSGSQRFSGDPDALCSVWWDKPLIPDDNSEGKKQRNFTWELRNGYGPGRSVTVSPDPANEHLPVVDFGPLILPDPNLNEDGTAALEPAI